MASATAITATPVTHKSGISSFFNQKIQDYEIQLAAKTQNLRRLEAQRNTLNSKVRALKDELKLLQEPGSYVGELIKVMGKKKASFG